LNRPRVAGNPSIASHPTRGTVMHRSLESARSTRIVAAALAVGVTWAVFGGTVSLGADDQRQLVAAIAARQPSTVVAAPAPAEAAPAPVIVAAAQ
jgi:hypothetical protein